MGSILVGRLEDEAKSMFMDYCIMDEIDLYKSPGAIVGAFALFNKYFFGHLNSISAAIIL